MRMACFNSNSKHAHVFYFKILKKGKTQIRENSPCMNTLWMAIISESVDHPNSKRMSEVSFTCSLLDKTEPPPPPIWSLCEHCYLPKIAIISCSLLHWWVEILHNIIKHILIEIFEFGTEKYILHIYIHIHIILYKRWYIGLCYHQQARLPLIWTFTFCSLSLKHAYVQVGV